MPPLPSIANVLRAVYSGTVGERNWANILHYQYGGSPPSSAALGAFATELASSWAAVMSPLQDTSTALTSIILTDLTSPTSGEGEWLGDNVGTREGAFLPASASMLINYPIDVRYRGGHPRQYLSVGVQSDLNDPQTWGSALRSAVETAWAAFTASLLGHVVGTATIEDVGAVSYRHLLAPRDPPVFIPYTGGGFVPNVTLANQRRRTRRTARH